MKFAVKTIVVAAFLGLMSAPPVTPVARAFADPEPAVGQRYRR
jgi:hypothetical protein